MIAKLLLQNSLFVILMGTVLFASAGTLSWTGAWVLLIASALLGPLSGLWLAKISPDLLAERLRPIIQREQPAADKAFMLVFVAVLGIWIIVMGLDHRLRASSMPEALAALGLVLYILSILFILRVFRENAFAAAVVKMQTERDHRVISSGPYALVRHPMYSGMTLFFIGVSLLLSSWWGFAFVPLFFLLLAARTAIEERALTAGLPGYADYAARVRYRLIPGLW